MQSLELSPELLIYKNVIKMVEDRIITLEEEIQEIEKFIGYSNNIIKYAESQINKLTAQKLSKTKIPNYSATYVINDDIRSWHQSIRSQLRDINKYEEKIAIKTNEIVSLQEQLKYQTDSFVNYRIKKGGKK